MLEARPHGYMDSQDAELLEGIGQRIIRAVKPEDVGLAIGTQLLYAGIAKLMDEGVDKRGIMGTARRLRRLYKRKRRFKPPGV